MVDETVLSEARAKGLRRILLVIAGLAGLLVLLAVATAFAGVERFAVVVGIIGLALLASSLGTVKVLPERGVLAKRGCLITAIFLIVFAVPLVAVWVGLIMAIAGVLLLFLLYAPERDPA